MEIISTCVLHRETKISYIGYTRWDSKQSFYDYILDPQDEFKELQQKIEESCNDLQVMHRMEILQDLDGNA
jgi:heme-degrading monooxygenase HmoA